VIESLDDVHDDRPAAQRCDLLVEGLVARIVARDQQHLHEAIVALGQHARQLATGVVVHDIARHRRAVMVALHRRRAGRQHALGRPAAGAGVHRLVQQAFDLGVLLSRRQLAGFGRLEAHDPDQQRRDRHVGQDIHRLRCSFDAVQELRKGHPVPRHAGLHGGKRDCLDARHGEHGALAFGRPHRREAEAAVADHNRGDAVPARERAIGIPEQLGVVVGMQVDEARRHDQAAGVDDMVGVGGADVADLGDAAILDADVGADAAGGCRRRSCRPE
jgi:hypothetical protein